MEARIVTRLFVFAGVLATGVWLSFILFVPLDGFALHLSPIAEAAEDGDVDEVRRLLDAGADPNIRDDNGETPLFRALQGNHYEVAELLIDRGATVSIRNNMGKSLLEDLRWQDEDDAGAAWLERHMAKVRGERVKAYQNQEPPEETNDPMASSDKF
jgi:hypothetical protein